MKFSSTLSMCLFIFLSIYGNHNCPTYNFLGKALKRLRMKKNQRLKNARAQRFNVRKARGSKKKTGSTQPYSFCGGRKRRETGGGGARRKGATAQQSRHITLFTQPRFFSPSRIRKANKTMGKSKEKESTTTFDSRPFQIQLAFSVIQG